MIQHSYYVNNAKIYERTQHNGSPDIIVKEHHSISIYDFLGVILGEIEDLRNKIDSEVDWISRDLDERR